jgi:UPF0148 protein
MTGDLSIRLIRGQYLKSFSQDRLHSCGGSRQQGVIVDYHTLARSKTVSIEVKKMAELLKSGATMLSETCPECGTPLFRKGKDTFCPKCNKPVMIIESAEQETRLMADKVLEDSEQTLFSKIREVNIAMKNETDPDRLVAYGNALSIWLGAIEKLRRLRTQSSE